jgi:hypothetical protein
MPKNVRAYIVVCGLALSVAISAVIPVAVASRNSAGTYSLPAGNPVVSGQPISSSWANTTLTDLATEVTNSLDRNGRGAMLAPLQLSTGSCAAPSLTFSADTDVGLYRAGANDARMCVASTALAKYTATGVTFLEAVASEKGFTATQSTANGNAITATANGSGAGVLGNSTTTAESAGIRGVTTTRYGVKGEATTGTGVRGQSDSSFGVHGTSTSGNAIHGQTATGDGVYGEATGGGHAFGVGSGFIKFWAANPASTTAYSNVLTPLNVPKAWAKLTSNGSGAVTVVDGFNVTSASTGGNYIDVTLASAMADTNYMILGVWSDGAGGPGFVSLASATTTTLFRVAFNSTSGVINFNSNAATVFITVFGRQ